MGRIRRHLAHDPHEIIALVDKQDRVIGKAPRKNHAGGKLHREVAVLLVNRNNEVLLQRRSDKSLRYFNFLDYSAGGHFPHNESYLQGALRETREELGLRIPKKKFRRIIKAHLISRNRGGVSDRFSTLYEIRGDYRLGDMKIDKSEVESVKFYSIKELKIALREEGNRGFTKMMKLYLKKMRY